MLVGLGGVRGLRGGLGHLQSGPRSTLQHSSQPTSSSWAGARSGAAVSASMVQGSVDMCRYTTLLPPVSGSVGCLSRDGDGGLGCTVLYTVHSALQQLYCSVLLYTAVFCTLFTD